LIKPELTGTAKRLEDLREAVTANKKRQALWAILRAVCFMAMLAAIVLATGLHPGYWALFTGAFGLFLWAISNHLGAKTKGQLLDLTIRINAHELKPEQNLFRNHTFAPEVWPPHVTDLDLLGPHSLFENLNRSFTRGGANLLAARFAEPLEHPSEIEAIQEAVSELTPKTTYRQQMMALALLNKAETTDAPNMPLLHADPTFFKWGVYLLTITTTLVLIGVLGFGWPYWILLAAMGHNFFWVRRYLKDSQNIAESLAHYENTFSVYAQVFEVMQTQRFESKILVADLVTITGASAALKKLQRLVNALEQRNNLLIGVIFNALFLYDLHLRTSYQKWTRTHQKEIENWYDVLIRWDYLCSLSQWQENHPEFVTPQFSPSPILNAKALSHPLISKVDRIPNDISLSISHRKCAVVTGSNMSGKSTFLRALGVNLILAKVGAVVCANRLEIYPFRILTAIRVKDDLHEGTSYFYAELKRLSWIVQSLAHSQPALVLLDEVLRGTNSDDKLNGTQALLKVLSAKPAITLLATHDLALGRLATEFPETFQNLAFESEIDEDNLIFDYKIRSGIAQNRNATFLMQREGIIPKTIN
jgi:DNA mismatch repair ATPase MutS